MVNTTTRQYIAKDLNLNFTTHPITGDLVYLKGEDVIKVSIKNIILTMFNERHFDSNFGSQINSVLFEPLSYFTNLILISEIERAIGLYEPRVTLLSVWGDPDLDDNGYALNIRYRIKNNSSNIISTNIFLERVR